LLVAAGEQIERITATAAEDAKRFDCLSSCGALTVLVNQAERKPTGRFGDEVFIEASPVDSLTLHWSEPR
jgi:hypothetical protein